MVDTVKIRTRQEVETTPPSPPSPRAPPHRTTLAAGKSGRRRRIYLESPVRLAYHITYRSSPLLLQPTRFGANEPIPSSQRPEQARSTCALPDPGAAPGQAALAGATGGPSGAGLQPADRHYRRLHEQRHGDHLDGHDDVRGGRAWGGRLLPGGVRPTGAGQRRSHHHGHGRG